MFLVIFRNRKRVRHDAAAYETDAAAMEALARTQPGFLSFKSYTSDDGEVVAMSEWASEEAARAWRLHGDHRAVQARGRDAYYESYTLFACDNPRVQQFDRSKT